jgi:hypothetical protein
MANKNKQKGVRGEAFLRDMLSKIFDLSFQRVPNSGAFTGGANYHRYEKMSKEQQLLHDGDIIVPHELAHFSIEVKNYAEFPFHLLFTGNCSQLDTWIKQASHTNKPFWLLFFKITRKNMYVCYPKDYKLVGSGNITVYQDKYHIELAEEFLKINKDRLLALNDENILTNSLEL